MPKSESRVEYRIPRIVWGGLAVLLVLVGAMFQKIQMLEGKPGILGLAVSKDVSPTPSVAAVASQPTYRAFDPKKDVGTISPKGDKNAKVKIVIFSDFECPYCGALAGFNSQVMDSLKSRIPGWEPAIPNIIKDYVDKGKVVMYFRDFAAHQNSATMHNAARCADEQGKFWEMHDALFGLQDEGGAGTDVNAKMTELAGNLGLDADKFDACLKAKKYQAKIDDDQKAASELGVGGTPHIFINEKFISGADGYAAFKKIIDEELKK